MQFSCKISNTLLNYLETQGEDLSGLYERSHLPIEVLSDSSRWISAPDMESFLELILNMPYRGLEKDILIQAGHEGPEIRAWGVLDSVLRMMPRPHEILNQPENFLSYFISPKPPVENLKRSPGGVSFDLPLPAEQYPLVTTYLKAAFESLPLFVGQPLAKCEWENIHLQICWNSQQKSFLPEESSRQVSPTLLQNLIADLESNQRELEDERKSRSDMETKIANQEKAIKLLQQKLRKLSGNTMPLEMGHGDIGFAQVPQINKMDRGVHYEIGQNLARLHDYMVRAQQLIVMLINQGHMNAQVKKAMRKVDWEYVKTQYPQTVAESMEALRKLSVQQNEQGAKNLGSRGPEAHFNGISRVDSIPSELVKDKNEVDKNRSQTQEMEKQHV